jgi:type VI secretion system protein VasG
MVDAMITNNILPTIGRDLLTRVVSGQPLTRVHLGVADGNFTYNVD